MNERLNLEKGAHDGKGHTKEYCHRMITKYREGKNIRQELVTEEALK